MTIPASTQNWPGKSRIRVSCSENVQVPLAKKIAVELGEELLPAEHGQDAEADDDRRG